MNGSLDRLFDAFKERYSHLIVKPEPVDITDAFKTFDGQYDAPRSYGNLFKEFVKAYVVFGAPLLKKYATSDSGTILHESSGKLIVQSFTDDMRVISCLCLYDMKNTSLHEIIDAMSRKGVQGYKRHHIQAIEELFKQRYEAFNVGRDTAFIFARENVDLKIALNSYWFTQIITHGSSMIDSMSRYESVLMQELFPSVVLSGNPSALEKHSYMYAQPIHTTESVEFLKRKVDAFNVHISSYDVLKKG